MQLADQVKKFSAGCEALLSAIEQNRALTEEEVSMIEYYLQELHVKISPRLPQTSV